MQFSVSVIIPVYNAERFIEKSIKSATSQNEVFEIIVVNDGSNDNTQYILEGLQALNSKIKIYHHSNKSNLGRSASRNLGIKNAKGNYIAFLDADDYYLENRFENDKKIFNSNKLIDGVYNAVSFHFYREVSDLEKSNLKLYTLTEKIDSKNLFEALLYGKFGHFHINGLTVKMSIFENIGYFNESLPVAEDTDLIWKMTLVSSLTSGILDKPLAVRGVHDSNVFSNTKMYDEYKIKMYESLFFWTIKNKIKTKIIDIILNQIWLFKYKEGKGLFKEILYWYYLFSGNLKYMFSTLSIKYFPIIRLRRKLFPIFYKN